MSIIPAPAGSDSSVADDNAPAIRTILFDLDGTLLDTAPDLAGALNRVRDEQGLPALPFERVRPVVSHGSIGLLRVGFDIEPDDPDFPALRERLLEIYRDNLAHETCLFPGTEELLNGIEARGMNWGVVTNKPGWLTEPLLEQLGLTARAACIVSGDSTPNRKPHPEPMLHACRLAGSHAAECLYVGDARRDIEAGRNAGMKTLIAMFGYIEAEEQPETWGADAAIDTPQQVLDWLDAQGHAR